MILSESKLFIQELLEIIGEENGYYTDTDSLYITEEGFEIIKKGRPDLIGKGLGQFDNDFDFPKGIPHPTIEDEYIVEATNLRAIYGDFLGKKAYLAIVVCDQYYDEKYSKEDREKYFIHYKVTLKGVSKEAINYVLKHVFNGDHKRMFKAKRTRSTGVVFDLTVGNTKPVFKNNFDGTICNLLNFSRAIGPF